jgi:hypothetical protein
MFDPLYIYRLLVELRRLMAWTGCEDAPQNVSWLGPCRLQAQCSSLRKESSEESGFLWTMANADNFKLVNESRLRVSLL